MSQLIYLYRTSLPSQCTTSENSITPHRSISMSTSSQMLLYSLSSLFHIQAKLDYFLVYLISPAQWSVDFRVREISDDG